MGNVESSGLEKLFFQSSSKYQIVDEIGRGGMGIIFLAKKNSKGVVDYVVLKSLRTIDVEEEEKLRQEAGIATMLRHENIVKTYGLESIPFQRLPPEFLSAINAPESSGKAISFLQRLTGIKNKGDEKSLLLLVMDYIKGDDFHNLLVQHLRKDILFPVPLAAFIISRIANALSYAHTYIIHRDVSPENMLINDQGVCKLTDFGVAVVTHQKPEDWAGKLMYMAPEQLRNQNIDERADIFALGLVAYQAITGIPLLFAPYSMPFEEQVQVILKQMEENLLPPHLVRADVPIELSRIICKMLSYAPEYRYQRASAVVNDLEKEYLYARGYGPTNNSLAAYIDIFKSNFQDYNEDQLQQLAFLKDASGQIRLVRPLTIDGYTKLGQKLLAQRKSAMVVKRLREIYEEKRQHTYSRPQQDKVPVIKVQYLANVVEAFYLTDNIVTVGRSARNAVVLPDKYVSGEHAKFYLVNGEPCVEDLGSQNGVFIGQTRINKTILKEGDKILIGTTSGITPFFFLWEKRPSAPAVTLSLSDEITPKEISQSDIALQFLPEEAMLKKLYKAIQIILRQTSVEGIKLNVIPTGVYETARILSAGNDKSSMRVRILRSRRTLGFYCSAPQNTVGYDALLGYIHQCMEREYAASAGGAVENQSISLILKAFDRIEMTRSTKEVGLFHFLVS